VRPQAFLDQGANLTRLGPQPVFHAGVCDHGAYGHGQALFVDIKQTHEPAFFRKKLAGTSLMPPLMMTD